MKRELRDQTGLRVHVERDTVLQAFVADVCSLDAILESRDHSDSSSSSCNGTLDSAINGDMLMLPCNFVPVQPSLFPSTHRSTG